MKTRILKYLLAILVLLTSLNDVKAAGLITITGNNAAGSGVSTGTIPYGTTGVVLYGFIAGNAGTAASLTQIRFNTTGQPISQFFTNIKLVLATGAGAANYATATKTNVTVGTTSGTSNTLSFSGITGQTLAAVANTYYYIVADYNTIGNTLTQNEQLTFADLTATGSTYAGAPAGQTLTLASPILTISNSTTGVYTGTTIAANTTYNLIGFTLSYTGPTNLHHIRFSLNYPNGGDKLTNYVNNSNGVVLYNAATNTAVSGVTYSINDDYIDVLWGLAAQSATTSYYLAFTFGSYATHIPLGINVCINSATNSAAAGTCGNNSNCTVNDNYINAATSNMCTATFTPPTAPIVTTTTPVTNIYGGTGTVGGNISSTGGATVTEYGIVYSTAAQSTNPTVANSKFVMGSGATAATTFSAPLQGLVPNTTYYVNAYAINSIGTSYGTVTSFTTLAAPNITYTTPQTYTVSTAITPLAPANAGGAVPANTYKATTTFQSSGTFSANYFMGFDAAGNMYVADYNGVYKITPSGTKTTFATGFAANVPTGIAVDPSGNVYLSGYSNNTIYKISSAGVVSTLLTSATLATPYGIRLDNAGNLYIASYNGGAGANVYKIAAGTSTLSTFATGFTGTYDLSPDNTGLIYVTDRAAGKIYKITSAGVKTQIGTGTFGSPTGISLAADGSIYFADVTNDNVNVIPSGSTTATSILSTGNNNPRSILLDQTGNFLYISNTDDGSITKESVTGYTYTGTLPAGLSFDYTTGTVSGTPTAVTAPAGVTINVVAYNSAGNSATPLTIIVNPPAPTVAGGTTLCGTGSTTLTASGGSPTGGTYNWYLTATGGTAIPGIAGTGTSYTPFVGGTTTFYVSYTTGVGVSARTPVTVTVNQEFASSINSPMISYPFESGALTDWSVLGNNAVISTAATTIAPTSTTDRNGIANGAYLFAGTSAAPSYMYSTTQYSQMPLVFSYSLWFKTTTGGGRLLGFSGTQDGNLAGTLNATHDRDLYMSNTGQIGFGIYNGAAGSKSIATTTTYLDGLWHHIVVSEGPTLGMVIYVDGVSRASGTYFSPQLSAGYWRIGGDATGGYTASPTNNFYQGSLDDIAIYNHEMTATEASSNDMNLYKFSTGYCANNTLTITAQNIPGTTYSWVDNATPSITATGLTASFTNATTTNYTLTTNVNSCIQNTAIVTPNNLTFTWTGSVDNNFNSVGTGTLTNWINSSTNTLVQTPKLTGTESIVIPSGLAAASYPVVNSNCSVYSLTLQSGATLNLNGKTVSVGCNIINSSGGKILYSSNNSSGITWAGSLLNQSFTGSTTAGTSQVGTMTISNTNAAPGTITINSGSLDVYYGLNMTTGNLAVTSPATLTLKSSSTQSAAVGILPSTCTISGLVNVERFITGNNSNSNRGYRILSSPVNQTSTTSSLSNTFSLSYLRDHTFNGIAYPGAYIGGTTGTAGGFNNQSYGPTVYLWDERQVNNNKDYTTGKNIGVNKLTTNTLPTASTVDLSDGTTGKAVPVGNGFELFFIGPSTRTTSNTATPPADAVLTASGYLNQQSITANLWYVPGGNINPGKLSYTSSLGTTAAGYNMVGNPYASTINLNSVLTANNSATGIDNIYLLSAKNSPNQTFIAFTVNGTSAPSAGYAVSGEGFIVHAKTTGSSLTFTESQKSPTTQLTGPALIMSAPKSEQLTVNGLSSGGLNTQIADISFAAAQDALTGMYVKIAKDSVTYNYCGIYFGSQWSANFQQGDAYDLSGNTPRVMMASFSADGIRSAVKHFPDYRSKNQLIKLYAGGKADGMYTLSLEDIRNIDTVNYKITLYDNYKKDSLDIGRYKSYAFNLATADTTTYGANRFVLGISQLAGSKYQLATFTAQKANNGVLVTWRALNEGNNYFFTLEKQQANGTAYSPVYNVQSNGGTIYNYTDKTPFKGNNVYRLKQTDLFGNITYAGPVSIYYDQTGSEGLFTVYPNPTAETLNINVTYGKTNTTASTYKLNIYDATGMLVMQKSSDVVNWSENVSQFKPGIYIVELKGNDGYLLGKAKFVKK